MDRDQPRRRGILRAGGSAVTGLVQKAMLKVSMRAPASGARILRGLLPSSSSPSFCTLSSGVLMRAVEQMPAAAPARWATPPRRRMACALPSMVWTGTCVAILRAWAVPLKRPTPRMAISLSPVPVARRARPARPHSVKTRPGWGRGEAERRLAGPGLGSAVVMTLWAWAVGRPPPCSAALPSTTAGGGGEQSGMRGTLRGPPDDRLRLQTLTLLLTSLAADRRREERTIAIRSSPGLACTRGV